RILRPFPCHRISDGTRISSQIGRSFLFDLSRLSAICVPSPSRKSSSASIRHASVLRFVSLAFPSFHYSFRVQIASAWWPPVFCISLTNVGFPEIYRPPRSTDCRRRLFPPERFVYADFGRSLSISLSPDFYIGICLIGWLSAPRFPM